MGGRAGGQLLALEASFKKVTEGIKEVIRQDREKQVVAMLGWGGSWQIRQNIENALRKLDTNDLDVFKFCCAKNNSDEITAGLP